MRPKLHCDYHNLLKTCMIGELNTIQKSSSDGGLFYDPLFHQYPSCWYGGRSRPRPKIRYIQQHIYECMLYPQSTARSCNPEHHIEVKLCQFDRISTIYTHRIGYSQLSILYFQQLCIKSWTIELCSQHPLVTWYLACDWLEQHNLKGHRKPSPPLPHSLGFFWWASCHVLFSPCFCRCRFLCE